MGLCRAKKGASTPPARPTHLPRSQVAILDGRLLAGTLACVDPQANLVLADAACLAAGGSGGGFAGGVPPLPVAAAAAAPHQLGTIIVTRTQRVACWLEAEPHEERAWRATLGGGG